MWRRKNDIINNGLLNDYKYLLDETNNKLDIKNSEIEKQKQIAEANLPSWYDHFWVGSVVASVIFVTLILVVK